MEVKYEPIFGDQSLFDCAPEDAEYAGWFCQETRWYMILNGKILFSDGGSWCTSDNPYLSADIAAMRRIIKTPVWTVADQQAGRLPQIGSKYMAGSDKREFTCLFHGKGNGAVSIIGFNSDDEVSGYQIQYCYPIETQAEKAQRLRSEWVKHALDLYMSSPKNDVASMGDVYDAMLSGELKAPGVE